MLCGTAFKNKGVQPMLDAVVDYLPSPLDVAAITGHGVDDEDEVIERKPDENEPFSALAFKIMSDPLLGKLTYVRVYSGHARHRHPGAQLDQGPQGAHRQDLPDAREQARGRSTWRSRATSSRSWA